LGWWNENSQIWTLAIDGNSANNATEPMINFNGSFAAFQALFGDDLSSYLGAYGFDFENGTVWAVIDHNSDFAVIPETGTSLLLILGAGAGWAFHRSRRRFEDRT